MRFPKNVVKALENCYTEEKDLKMAFMNLGIQNK